MVPLMRRAIARLQIDGAFVLYFGRFPKMLVEAQHSRHGCVGLGQSLVELLRLLDVLLCHEISGLGSACPLWAMTM